jgi:hypothetical protein
MCFPPLYLLVALSIGGTACLAQQLVLIPQIDGGPPLPDLDPGASLQPISVFCTAVPDNAVKADYSAVTLASNFGVRAPGIGVSRVG